MGLVFFEGFETSGTLTGSANAATVRPEIDHRIFIYAGVGTGAVWLVDNFDATGFAISMGTSFNNQFRVDTTVANFTKGPEGPMYTLGARIHIPSTARDFYSLSLVEDDFTGGGSGIPEVSLFVDNSADLIVRRGGTNIASKLSGVVAGDWHYLELAMRVDGFRGRYATAEVQTTGIDGDNHLDIMTIISHWEIWDSATSYSIDDEVRRFGRAYIALLANTGSEPIDNPLDWSDTGAYNDLANTNGLLENFSDFYIEEDPQKIVRNFNANDSTDLTDIATLTFTGGNWDVAEYLPQAGDRVVIGGNPYFEVKVDGTTQIRGQEATTTTPTPTYYNNQIDRAVFKSNTVTDTGEDYIAYDDVYVSQGTVEEFIGPVIVIKTAVASDGVTTAWTTSTGTDHYALLDENPNDDADYVQSTSNGDIDQFSHESYAGSGILYGVKLEVEAINTTAGSPTLKATIAGPTTGTVTHVVDNTGDSEVFSLQVFGQFGGEDLNSLTSEIESGGL